MPNGARWSMRWSAFSFPDRTTIEGAYPLWLMLSSPRTPAFPSPPTAPTPCRAHRFGACRPKQRAVDDGAIIAGQVHDPGLNHEAAEFDQVPRPPAAFDLPGAHVMPPPRSLMPVAHRLVAVERRQRRDQAQRQIAASGSERTRRRAWPMPPSSRRLSFRPVRSARQPVRRRSARRLQSRCRARQAVAPFGLSGLASCLRTTFPKESFQVLGDTGGISGANAGTTDV